jgi:hypothetical protein
MKQYYEDSQIIFPFKKVFSIIKEKNGILVFSSRNKDINLLDPERFVKEYRAWLDGENENARN